MEFNCKVHVVDAIMGAGKTESIINMINNSNFGDEKFLVITPYLDEIKRYKEKCKEKKFKEPQFKNGTKLENLKALFEKGHNIVSTHAMFQKFDQEVIDLCRMNNYTLIMDEVANVVEEKYISKQDYDTLMKYTEINPETKQLIWKPEYKDYEGKFADEKRLCNLGSLVVYGNELMVWLFPIAAFNAFRKVYILTYMFNVQLQRYYYDYYKLPYDYLSVEGTYNKQNFHLIPYDKNVSYIKYNYKELIHILDNEKMNRIGDTKFDLSKTWYERNKSNVLMSQLRNNLITFFRRIRNDKSSDNLWTTFKDYKEKLKGPSYTKGFLASNARATNEFQERTSIAYPINKYLNPYVKNFFMTNMIFVDEEGYALSEMLQFIWRSAIRNGEEIYVYIPSIRMRELLIKWIEENPIVNNLDNTIE